VSRKVVLDAGGFDESFPLALAEDIELGIRLERAGLRVRYEPRAACDHEHTLTLDGYLARQRALSGLLLRMYRTHGGTDLLAHLTGSPDRDLDLDELRVRAVDDRPSIDRAEAEIRRALDTWGFRAADRVPPEASEGLGSLLRAVAYGSFRDGLIEALEVEGRIDDPPAAAEAPGTSVVVLSLNGKDDTRACLESLRASEVEPREILVVDNGSTDGSAEMLREWPGIRLIANETNLGAVAARNQAIRAATGDSILFLDNDTVLPPGALRILRSHLDRDLGVGMVGPLSNCAKGRQEVRPPDYGSVEEMGALAAEIEATAPGAHEDVEKLILFCLLVRREVFETIGGMDARFDPWGYEDDDFTLRAWIVGYRLRIARDAYVHHAGSKTSTAAKIDYRALLARNWSRFKAKWGLPDGLTPEAPLDRAALRQRWRGNSRLFSPVPEEVSGCAAAPEPTSVAHASRGATSVLATPGGGAG
jgi:GT2 family glycosyltransferase